MEATVKLFLDSNRHHLHSVEIGAGVKNMQTERMIEIVRSEFIPGYGNVDPYSPDDVVKLLQDTYREYDKWLKANCY